MAVPPQKRPPVPASPQARNKAINRRNWSKIEDYLTGVEKTRGFDHAWALRERLENGDITLDDLKR